MVLKLAMKVSVMRLEGPDGLYIIQFLLGYSPPSIYVAN